MVMNNNPICIYPVSISVEMGYRRYYRDARKLYRRFHHAYRHHGGSWYDWSFLNYVDMSDYLYRYSRHYWHHYF